MEYLAWRKESQPVCSLLVPTLPIPPTRADHWCRLLQIHVTSQGSLLKPFLLSPDLNFKAPHGSSHDLPRAYTID